jgi:hypothetical protein
MNRREALRKIFGGSVAAPIASTTPGVFSKVVGWFESLYIAYDRKMNPVKYMTFPKLMPGVLELVRDRGLRELADQLPGS